MKWFSPRKFIAFAALLAACSAFAAGPIRVACIGDSITAGYLLADPATESYPAQMQALLGDRYIVGNFGNSGQGVYPHLPSFFDPSKSRAWKLTESFDQALAFNPDIVVAGLGINDISEYGKEYTLDGDGHTQLERGMFRREYLEVLEAFRRRNPNVKFVLWTKLGPLGTRHQYAGTPTAQEPFRMRADLEALARQEEAVELDVYTPLASIVEDLDKFQPDGIHPTAAGARILAETVAVGVRAVRFPNFGSSLHASLTAGDDEPFTWGGRERHRAVVNPVLGDEAANVVSLRGTWECTANSPNLPNRNGSWGFFPAAKWKDVRTIEVPSCWESQGIGKPGMSACWDPTWDENSKQIRHKYMGSVWYRKRVKVPKAWAGKRIWIRIGGIKSVGWVWVNDRQVALVDDYCGTYKYEITDLVKPGEEAKVVVEADNRRPSRKGLMSAMHKWGGIYRDIELEATPQVCIDDVWVRGDFDNHCAQVKVEVEGEQWNGSLSLRATIEDETKEIAFRSTSTPSAYTLEVPLRNFRPWSPEHPNLYTAKVELVSADGKILQVRRERFGARKLEVVGREFRLNGKPFFFRGFGDDHIYPLTGLSPADRGVHRAHLAKARAAGFNAVRLHTHCEVSEYFDAADELGILIQVELPYYSDVPTESFPFDPKRDVTELYEHYRRHPSFAVYSMGNEGSFGDALDRRMHRYVKAMDPDRLKINQDSQDVRLTAADRSDYDGGPINVWPRGSRVTARPFICHEYLNLCVKFDSRSEDRYSGVWMPPVTRADRAAWLARFGLDHDWGDRLQDAQHVLQSFWQKHGIESARADAGCGGYHFWTVTDVVVWNAAVGTYTAQGLFDPFWDEKPHGMKATDFAVFNSPSCVLVDFKPSDSVVTAGQRLSADVLFAHFGDAPVCDGKVEWRLLGADRQVLLSGMKDVGPLALGPARKIDTVDCVLPPVLKPMRTSFEVTVRDKDGSFCQSNAWTLWLFPKGPSHKEIVAEAVRRGVVIAASNSEEAKAALAAGKNLVTVDGAEGKPNVGLGWWWIGNQVGTAIKDHPVFGDFPHEDVMTPTLWSRLIKDAGLALPAAGIETKDLIMVGEGGTACFSYLAERTVGASRIVSCNGIDLLSDTPEGNSLLLNIIRYLGRK